MYTFMMQIDARARATFQRNNSLGYLITWTGIGIELKIYKQKHYELKYYENPMKMLLKTQESIFQGPEYRYSFSWPIFQGMNFL